MLEVMMQVQVNRRCCDPVMLGDDDVWLPVGGRECCHIRAAPRIWEGACDAVGVVAAA